MASSLFFKQLRILILLFILLLVAGDAWLSSSRATDWDDTLWAAIYPINAGDRRTVDEYISELDDSVYSDAEEFFAREAKRYGVAHRDIVRFRLGPEIHSLPPAPPTSQNVAAVMWWSLRLRFWAMRTGMGVDGPPADIRLYVIYHDPVQGQRLLHSVGLKEGLIGVINVYASHEYSARNNVVISHEFLHTLGATDKYDPHNKYPVYPDGFAEPRRKPLYPQSLAEIMGGRIPLTPIRSEIPASLNKSIIGRTTALEINWPGN